MFRWKKISTSGGSSKSAIKNTAAYGTLALAIGAMTFFGVCTPSGPGSLLPGGAAAEVDSIAISSQTFRRSYQNTLARYQQQYKEQFDPQAMNLSKRVLDQLVNDHILFIEAKRSGIWASDSSVHEIILDAQVFRDEKGKFDGERFDNFLRSQGYTEQSFTDEIRRNLTNDKLRRLITEGIYQSKNKALWNHRLSETKLDIEFLKLDKSIVPMEISQADIDAFIKDTNQADTLKQRYEKDIKLYDTPKKVRASHILIAFKGARNATGPAASRSEADAKTKALGLLKQAKAKKTPFSTLARQHTDDPSGKTKSGDLGFFEAGDMVKEFSDVAFKMKPQEISELVKSPFGFHIIKVTDIQEAKKISLEQAQNEIAKKLLKEQKAPELFSKLAEELFQDLKNNDPKAASRIKELGLSWETTGAFALTARYIPTLGSDTALKEAVLKLSQPNQLAEQVIDAAGYKYILRLKTKQAADTSKLSPSKIDELAKSGQYFEAFATYGSLIESIQKTYKDKGKVWENPAFRDLDLNRATSGS